MHIRSRLALLTLSLAVVSQSYARLPELPQPQKTPAGLSIADWSAIRAEYDRHRRGFFPVGSKQDGEYHARSYSQQWLAKFDGRGFEVKPNEGAWTWGLQLVSYGFAGAEHTIRDSAKLSAGVDHGAYKWNSEIEEWFVNEPQGLEHGFTIARRPDHPHGPLTLHLEARGGLTAHTSGTSATFLDPNGTARITYSNLQATDARGLALNVRMLTEPNGLRIEVEEASAVYPIRIDPVAQQAYLKASNADSFDQFGYSVAISGNTVVVGSLWESSNARGVNGNQSDNSDQGSGAAYVFVRNGSTWSQQAYLKASNADPYDHFGKSVAISGNTIVVGAIDILTSPGGSAIIGAEGESSSATGVNGDQSNNSARSAGAAYVFVRSGTVWSQQAYLKASNTDGLDPWAIYGTGDLFGYSVAVSGDTVVVGAPGESSGATGVGGNQSDNSAYDAGAAYVFVRNGSTWSQQAYLKASNTDAEDYFGWSVAISGDTVVVGSPRESSGATGVGGNQSDNSAAESGAVYVFLRNGTTWNQQAYIKASNSENYRHFGLSVAISGNTMVAGQLGAVFVFVGNGTTWSQQAVLTNPNPLSDLLSNLFGGAVAISGDTVLVGTANFIGNHAYQYVGAAHIFIREGNAWSRIAYLEPPPDNLSNTEDSKFGYAIGISGDSAAVGALRKYLYDLTNPIGYAGAAYIFATGTALEFVTSVSPSAPLRSASGWVGMHLAVDDARLIIKSLGRYCLPGNSQIHTVKLVSANTKNDVPNATTSVDMAGCTPGEFVHADLATPVTLTPHARYYLVSQEVNGGDKWLDLGPVTTNRGASVLGNVYYNNVLWITTGPVGTAYVPTSMKYEIQETPASSAFITSYNLDNRIQRNNFTGFVGMQLRIGSAPLTLNSVGRACIPGNSQPHIVKFVDKTTGADVPGSSAVVNMSGCGTDFVYQTLASPIVLQANTTYYLVSSETQGGDTWTDQSQLTTSPDATVLTSIYSLNSGYTINEANAAYVPPNFLYTK